MPEISFDGPPTGPISVEPDRNSRLTPPAVRLTAAPTAAVTETVLTVKVRVTGDPVGAATLATAYGSPQPLREYDRTRGDGDLTLAVKTLDAAAVNATPDLLPAGEYTLKVEVKYQIRPQFKGGTWGQVVTVDHGRTLEVRPHSGPVLAATWKRQELSVGGSHPAELTVTAERLPGDAQVFVTVDDPGGRLPGAVPEAVNRALRTAQPPADAAAGGPRRFVITAAIPDPDEALRTAITSAGPPLRLGLLVRALRQTRPAAGSRAAENETLTELRLTDARSLVVDLQSNVFDGYPVIDLGTSSVFAVIRSRHGTEGFLPVEQQQSYRAQLGDLLARTDGVCGTAAWQQVLANAARDCGVAVAQPANPTAVVAALKDWLWLTNPTQDGALDTSVHRVVRAIEKSAASVLAEPADRRAIRRLLAGLHAQAFARFPLAKMRLTPVALDPDEATAARAAGRVPEPIPSTTEVTRAGDAAGQLTLAIGKSADRNRRDAMTGGDPAALTTRFHSSPKLYYDLLGQAGKEVAVSDGVTAAKPTPHAFLVAALVQLREQLDAFRRSHSRLGPPGDLKRFSQVVLTFPASAGLNVRQGLEAAAKAAGFDRPDTSMDEALSAIVFHLVKPIGDDKEFGLEGYRAASRPVPRPHADLPREWRQNVLLVDVGAGTTDIALVEAVLTDETPPTADPARGRFYCLTPRLRGVTGKRQLAGNLLTLYLFHEIKMRLADAVLAAVPSLDGGAADAGFVARVRAAELPEAFAAGGGYRPGSLVQYYDAQALWEGDRVQQQAHRLADAVVATAWRDGAAEPKGAARRFLALWELAESLKVDMFAADRPAKPYTLTAADRAEVLGVSPELADRLPTVTLTLDHVRTAFSRPLQAITLLAVDLARRRLPDDPRADPAAPPRRTLDRIVLTGRMCQLPQVREDVTAAFRRACDDPADNLRWDSAHLTYEREYAKQAAAIGASYARMLRETRNNPNEAGPADGNQLVVDIENLTTYLPCSFKLQNPGGANPTSLLTIGAPFHRRDAQQLCHWESGWTITPTEVLTVLKFDYEGSAADTWGVLDGRSLSEEAKLPWPVFQAEVKACLEVDQRQVIHLLFCRGGVPHYELPSRAAGWNLARRLAECDLIPADAPDWQAAADGLVVEVNVHSPCRGRLFELRPGLCDLPYRDDTPTAVAAAEGLQPLPPPLPQFEPDRYYVRPADGSRGWTELGSVPRPATEDGAGPVRVVLTAAGELRFQTGELRYRRATRPTDLQQPGVVLRRAPAYPPPPVLDKTDPFCGRH